MVDLYLIVLTWRIKRTHTHTYSLLEAFKCVAIKITIKSMQKTETRQANKVESSAGPWKENKYFFSIFSVLFIRNIQNRVPTDQYLFNSFNPKHPMRWINLSHSMVALHYIRWILDAYTSSLTWYTTISKTAESIALK